MPWPPPSLKRTLLVVRVPGAPLRLTAGPNDLPAFAAEPKEEPALAAEPKANQPRRCDPEWWKRPLMHWPLHRRLSPSEYDALFPECWAAQGALSLGVCHPPGDWVHCQQCRDHFGPKGYPSIWFCRCGLHDLHWRHRERPHANVMCDACQYAIEEEFGWDTWSLDLGNPHFDEQSVPGKRHWDDGGAFITPPTEPLPF